MKKRVLYLVGIIAVFALIAAACGDDDFEAGALGAVSVGPGEEIQIRSLQAITGAVAFLGIPNQRAVEFAVADFGPIGGHNVTIGTPLDDLCSAEGGQAAAQTIVADDSVVGIIGTSCSSAAGAALPPISAAGMVMISSSNTSPTLTSDLRGTIGVDWQKGYYRTAHNDLFQGAAVARFVIEELGLTKVATLHDGSIYANGLTTAFSNVFAGLGGETVAAVAISVGDTDMTGVLTEIAGNSPEAIFFPIFQPEGDFLIQQVGSISGLENVKLIGADGILNTDFLALPEASGMWLSGPDVRFGENESETGETETSFLSRYDAAYSEVPAAPFWAHSYDATVLLLSAIEAVAVEDGDTLLIDRQALRDELDDTSGFSGIIGELTCDEFGDCGAQRVSVVFHAGDAAAAMNNVVFAATRDDLIDLISGE